jgi:hypothetical protein
MQNEAPRRIMPTTVRPFFTGFNLILSPGLVNRAGGRLPGSGPRLRAVPFDKTGLVQYIKEGLTDGKVLS